MFSRNSQYGTRRENTPNPAETDNSITAFFTRGGGGGGEKRGRDTTKKGFKRKVEKINLNLFIP